MRLLKYDEVRAAAAGGGACALAFGIAAYGRRRADRARLRREVSRVMSSKVQTVRAGAPVAQAAERLAASEAGALPVCDSRDRLVGMVTDRDIVVRILAQGEDPARVPIGEVVTPDPATVAPRTTLGEASEQMERHAVRRLPVVADGKVVGMLSEADLARHATARQLGMLDQRLARQPSDRPSAAWLFHRAHGGPTPHPSPPSSSTPRGHQLDVAMEAARYIAGSH